MRLSLCTCEEKANENEYETWKRLRSRHYALPFIADALADKPATQNYCGLQVLGGNFSVPEVGVSGCKGDLSIHP